MSDEQESLVRLVDEAGTRLVEVLRDQGLVGVFIHQTGDNDVRLICPQSLEVALLLRKAADMLSEREAGHRC